MSRLFKIILICHTFQLEYRTRRWKLFAEEYPNVDVVLLTPSSFTHHRNKAYSYGTKEEMKGKEITENNFRIRTYRLSRFEKTWLSPDFKRIFIEEKPDIIYNIGNHQQMSLIQIRHIVRRYLPKTKIIAFSMRGPASNLRFPKNEGSVKVWLKEITRYLFLCLITKRCVKGYDALFCHYPDAVKCFRDEGYDGPIYMQTQVGYNTEWFYPDDDMRKGIRKKYNIDDDTYLFGSASRFTEDKGLDDIINALPSEGNWKYMMMGTGSESDICRLNSLIESRGLKEKIILPGYIERLTIPKYWNAIDCAIHVPRTTNHWEETFSLSIIQAMGTRKPIIGNTSGSVPYQIGPDGMIVQEGDIIALRNKIQWVLDHKDEAVRISERMFQRAVKCFSVQALNRLFYRTLDEDILTGQYDDSKFDMTNQ